MSAVQPIVRSASLDRVERLRSRIIEAPREACVERARYFTQSMAENWDRHPLTRMSLALEHVIEKISVIIRDDELIVGCRTSRLKGAPFFPENKCRWIEKDMEGFGQRELQNVKITAEQQRELREDILPFWRGRTVEDHLEEALPEDVARDIDKYVFTMVLEITYGIGHFTMDHSRILKTGLEGIASDAEQRYAALSAKDREGEKGRFYDAAARSCRAAIRFANRHADVAERMAGEEPDPARAEELRAIAETCRRVPAHPARTFHEAVQCVYFIHLVAQIESGGNSVSLGRIDQHLFPYYEADRQAGAITPDRARELLSMLFLKTNEIWNILEDAFIPGGEGVEGKTTQNVTVGGMGPDGEDVTNELSYIGLDAFAALSTVQPNFGVRVGPGTPDDFFLRAVRYAKAGVPLHLFNDEVIVESLQRAGHTLEDARDYGVVGCLEPNAQGKSFGSTFAVQFSGMKCLEFALSDGMDSIFGSQSGLSTGDPGSFSSFEDVWNAYDAQVRHFMGQMARGMAVLDKAIADRVPSPFASAMIDGPFEKGMDLTRGGAVYNSTGVQLIGFSNVVDSLYAVKEAVFEEGVVTMKELSEMLLDDWDDAGDRRAYFLNRIPKYGNDDDGADSMAARVLDHFCDRVLEHRNYRGGTFWPGVFSVGFHIAMGAFAGASPDGRFAGDVLGNGITPSNGSATTGPTAIMNSVTKLPLLRAHNGVNLNMRFNPVRLRPETLGALLKTYFKKGGVQVQFNMIDSAVLREAQAHPEKHRDLVVRVSGYSALFTGLSEIAQNEIISRTEFEC
ncbi:MAG: formate C-acetyltransferase/glycerol dehydratase family glycyl radical enzyme [Deltaproteobacteria bacterium]|nr:formate C-acetyltransferase/glycerol dehydratase family glycyl radical enzyme [Deltaproteobacteria bacterium]